METLEFTTPTAAGRDPQPIAVDFAGHEFVVHRPKDWVILSAQTAMAENITDTERALGIVQFLLGTLGESEYYHFIRRTLTRDDGVHVSNTISFIGQLLRAWSDYQPGAAITIDAVDDPIHGEPVRVVNDDLGLDLVFSPPKDIAIMIFAATASSTEDWGQQWACEYFLDATLGRGEAMALKRRLRMPSSSDPIDVAHLDPIIEALLERWSPATAPAANRAERRASQRGSRSTSTRSTSTRSKTTSSGTRSKTTAGR